MGYFFTYRETSQFRKIDIEINSKFTIVIGCRYSLMLKSWQRICFVIREEFKSFPRLLYLMGPVELVDGAV